MLGLHEAKAVHQWPFDQLHDMTMILAELSTQPCPAGSKFEWFPYHQCSPAVFPLSWSEDNLAIDGRGNREAHLAHSAASKVHDTKRNGRSDVFKEQSL